MDISVLILAYNEEVNLPRLFEPLKEISDIVLLDHESTDSTVKLAESFGARVFTRPFPYIRTTEDDVVEFKKRFGYDPLFVAGERIYSSGEERYLGGKLAKNNWILNLDCDEFITWDLAKVKEDIKHFDIINCKFFHERNLDLSRKDWIQTSKLYNREKTWWVGRTHEVLHGNGLAVGWSDNMEIDHYSRASEGKRKHVNQLEYSVLRDADLRSFYYLGIEYHHWEYYEKAIQFFHIYLRDSNYEPEKVKAYLTLADCFWELGKEDEAWIYSMQALKISPDNLDTFLFLHKIAPKKQKEKWLNLAKAAEKQHLL